VLFWFERPGLGPVSHPAGLFTASSIYFSQRQAATSPTVVLPFGALSLVADFLQLLGRIGFILELLDQVDEMSVSPRVAL
jgi:hypothetical protein